MVNEVELKKEGKISRLTNKTFNFPKELKEGFYSANYFLKTREIVKKHLANNKVTMQFFQRADDVMVCGLDEVIAMLHTCAENPQDLEILALNDGDLISNGEPVLKITGRYEDFGFLESAIDGILARRSSVATNTMRVIRVTNGKRVLNMGDRQDDFRTQIGDGYASYVAGLSVVSTDAQAYWYGGKGGGTMPHALIQMCDGDICKAADIYLDTFPDRKVTALIDYHNNVVYDSVMLAKHMNGMLQAVRVDTSKSLIDHYFDDKDTSGFDPHGVCKELIFALREELDKAGFKDVQIIVSSGFTWEKIKEWEDLNVPVDVYGVGSSLLPVTVGFTGDLVNLNGKPQAKEGREEIPSNRLKKVNFPIY